MFAKLTACGRLSRDPETREGGPCRFSIATSRTYMSKKSGEKVEETEWINVTAWGKLGELCQQYLEKGRAVLVEARPKTREYEDKEGIKRKAIEWIADSVTFLPGNKKSDSSEPTSEPTSAPADDDDIPF